MALWLLSYAAINGKSVSLLRFHFFSHVQFLSCNYYHHYYHYRAIGIISKVLANGPEDWGSILCRVLPKPQKMVLDAALLKTQHNKV